MEIKRIYAENYKTYRHLDLNLEGCDEERPIILIGGMNGCGKTTLFDAIYHALYGLDTGKGRKANNKKLTKAQFIELFNAGEMVSSGMKDKMIVLEITFEGRVLNRQVQYKLRRAYKLMDDNVVESVELNMDGNRFVYGTGSTAAQKAQNMNVINKIIGANLPQELSQYFLFDAMQTGKLVQTSELSQLITDNINMVMGLGKYKALQDVSEVLLSEKKADRMADEEKRKKYAHLIQDRNKKKEELQNLDTEYNELINYANEHRDEYDQLQEGHTADEVTQSQITKLNDALKTYSSAEKKYVQDANSLVADLEVNVLYPKIAHLIKDEIEVLLSEKRAIANARGIQFGKEQIEKLTHDIVAILQEKYGLSTNIDINALTLAVIEQQNQGQAVKDRFANLGERDVKELERVANGNYSNPFIAIDRERERLNEEQKELPRKREQLEELRQQLGRKDYSFLELYEQKVKRITTLKGEKEQLKTEIEGLDKEIKKYDFDIPQIPDPKYDTLCRLPEFFATVYGKLFADKKTNIERRMRELLNINLVIYKDMIGKVELTGDGSKGITFKIYHKNRNEIYLSQLNAGAKQTVMQVLLKVLYELGDYNPPVIIDTVMGVLDKKSREVILEEYFPNLSHQTILLSTDTEITTEVDFKKIQAHVAKTFTLHRDPEQQCTVITEDYFGLRTKDV
jgi:DNA sulfur modification protein DndD